MLRLPLRSSTLTLLTVLFHIISTIAVVKAQSSPTESPKPSPSPSSAPTTAIAPSTSPSLTSCLLNTNNGLVGVDSEIVTFVAVEFDYLVTIGVSQSLLENTTLPALEVAATTFLAPLLIEACGSAAASTGTDIVGIDTAPTDEVITLVECTDTTFDASQHDCFRIHSEWTMYVSTTAVGVEAAFESAFDAYAAQDDHVVNLDYNVSSTTFDTTDAPSSSPTAVGFEGCTGSLVNFTDCTEDCFTDLKECYSDVVDEIKSFKETNTTLYYISIAAVILTLVCCICLCCACCRRRAGNDKDDDDDDDDGEKGRRPGGRPGGRPGERFRDER